VSQPTEAGCRQPNCPVAEDGTCLEGLDPSECPHFLGWEEAGLRTELGGTGVLVEGDADAPDSPDDVFTGPGLVELFSGEELDLDAARAVMGAILSRVVVVAGDSDTGKTTLIASLHQAFQEGPFAGYLFAGSLTQPAFERRLFLARTASGRSAPTTERTSPTEEDYLLHLLVRHPHLSSPPQQLLLSDISGETFRQLRHSEEEVLRHPILRRADHFVLLLDTARLADPARRHEVKSNGAMLLRSCLDSGALGLHTYVEVVFSRWDLAEGRLEENATGDFIAGVERALREQFAARTGRMTFHRVASRPTHDSPLPERYHVDELFGDWMSTSPRLTPPPLPEMEIRATDRQIAHFHSRPLARREATREE